MLKVARGRIAASGNKPKPVQRSESDTQDFCRGRLVGAGGSARGVGRRADRAAGAVSRALTLGQVPSAHNRLYQRQHVVQDA